MSGLDHTTIVRLEEAREQVHHEAKRLRGYEATATERLERENARALDSAALILETADRDIRRLLVAARPAAEVRR